jgi:uncharacterized protein involved in outer membrane biogenesis
MKKWIIRITLVLVVLVVAAVVALTLSLDSAVKKGVETIGPELTKVSIKLDGVSLSVLNGSGQIKGLEIGNPEGYKAPTSIKLNRAAISVSPGSLLSDKIVIKFIHIDSPEINIEGTPSKNNLTKILENIQAATGATNATATAEEPGATKKLQVDEFILSGAKINYTLPGVGTTVPITIPDIKMNNLGTGPDGITAADLSQQVFSKLIGELGPSLSQAISNAGKQVLGNASDSVNKAVGEAGKTLQGVTDLFKKK